jgi:hypothetical protein
MKSPAFFDKAGWLTRYALACGYVQQTECSKADNRVTLWCANAETGQFDVSIVIGGIRTQWEAFETPGKARAFYRRNVTRLFGSLQYRFESNPDVARAVIK